MARPATIARVLPNGKSAHIWTSTHAGDKRHQELLVSAIGEHKINEPGLYLVSTVNPAGLPATTLFTVSRTINDTLTVEIGARLSERVNRWPPKS